MDDDATRAADLEAAWPEEDDLTLSGTTQETETETLQEVYNEPETSESTITTDDPTEGQVAATGELLDSADPNSGGLPEGEGENPAAEGSAEPDGVSPVSWSATAREQWKDIPKEAQAYILQREQQMQQGMQKNAEQANRANAMDRTLQPYQQYFAMNGGAGQTLQTLLQTGAGLQMGSPQQKAELVANIINQYGVDVQSLDNLLTGGAVAPEVAQQSAVQAQIAQAIAPYQQQLEQQRNQQQQWEQSQRQEAGGEVTQFAQDPKNEFYNDVRGDMADILDMAANRGVQMSMPDAYSRACQLNPEISRIMKSREQQRNLAPKRRAAATISGNLGGPGGSTQTSSMSDDINAAWESQGQM